LGIVRENLLVKARKKKKGLASYSTAAQRGLLLKARLPT